MLLFIKYLERLERDLDRRRRSRDRDLLRDLLHIISGIINMYAELRSRSRPEPAFLAGAGAEKITKFQLRLHYKGRQIK